MILKQTVRQIRIARHKVVQHLHELRRHRRNLEIIQTVKTQKRDVGVHDELQTVRVRAREEEGL